MGKRRAEMTNKKSQIASNVFVYILAIVVIAIILLMGYKYVSGAKDTISDADMLLLEKRITSDIESVRADFGSEKKVSYSISGLVQLCLVDVDKIIKDNKEDELNDYPLIKDSVLAKLQKNAFIIGKDVFEAFDVGKIKVEDSTGNPTYVTCSESGKGKIDLTLTGQGDSTLIS
jgi:hypothetical protein